MWTAVEQAVEEVRPVVEAYGLTVAITDVLDGIVTLQLHAEPDSPLPFPENLPDLLTRTLQSEVPEITEVIIERNTPTTPAASSGVSIAVDTPEDTETTAKFELDQPVVPGGSIVFHSAKEAEGWPLVQAVFAVPGVVLVMGRENTMLVSRDDSPWDAVIDGVSHAITTHFQGDEPVTDVVRSEEEQQALEERVRTVLDDVVNPAVASHGGNIQLLDIKGSTAFVHMGGGCQGCGMASVTLMQGVESMLKEQVPEIRTVLDTTDHAAGKNPYYQSQS